jgi:hypothetical protein
MKMKFTANCNSLKKTMSFDEYIDYQFLINYIYEYGDTYTNEIVRNEEFYNELPLTNFIDDILKMLNDDKNIIKKSFGKYSIMKLLFIEVKNKSDVIKTLNNKMNLYGWILTRKRIVNENISLEFQGKSKNEIQNDDDFVFYTITPTIFLSRINDYGLCSRAINNISNIGERLYLYSYSDDDNIKKHIIDSFDKNIMDYQYKKEYTLLQVDVGKTNPKTRLFVEPGVKDKIYTLENIPKQHIKPLKTYSLDENGVIVN